MIDGFLAENPDVSAVTWDAQGPIEEATTRLMTAHLAGEPIDLIACAANNTNGSFIRRGVVRDITADIAAFQDRIDPAALAAYTVGGKVYGVPISTLSTSTFFYNADLFEELGIAPPATYEEFQAIAQTLSEAGYIPVLHQGKNPWMWPMWYFETSAQTMGDPIAKTESNLRGETKFTDPEDVQALAAIGRFVEDGILDQDSLTVDWDGMRSAFATQQSAIYYGGTWELPWLDENVQDFTYGVFPFPKLADTPRRAATWRRSGQRHLRLQWHRGNASAGRDQIHRVPDSARRGDPVSGGGSADRSLDQGRAGGRDRDRHVSP